MLLLMMGLGACSPFSWLSNSKEDAVKNTNHYAGTPKKTCSAIGTSEEGRLTPARFRAIVDCFNSDGSIEPLHIWVNDWTAEQTQDFIDWTNAIWFENPKTVHQFQTWLDHPSQAGEKQRWMETVATVLKNPHWLRSFLRLFRNEEIKAQGGSAYGDPRLLKALSEIGSHLNPQTTRLWLSELSRLAHHPAFDTVVDRMARGDALLPLVDLRRYLKNYWSSEDYPYLGIGHQLSHRISDQTLFRYIDLHFGEDAKTIAQRSANFGAVLRHSFRDRSTHMLRYSGLSRDLAARSLDCLESTLKIAGPPQKVLAEWYFYAKTHQPEILFDRNFLATYFGFASFCEIPASIQNYYESFVDADRKGLSAEIARTLMHAYEVQTPQGHLPIFDLLLNVQLGPEVADNSRPALFDARDWMDRLTVTGTTENLLLLLSSLDPQSRRELSRLSTWLNEPERYSSFFYWFKDSPKMVWKEFIEQSQMTAKNPGRDFKTLMGVWFRLLTHSDDHPILDMVRTTIDQSVANQGRWIGSFADAVHHPSFEGVARWISQRTATESLLPLIESLVQVSASPDSSIPLASIDIRRSEEAWSLIMDRPYRHLHPVVDLSLAPGVTPRLGSSQRHCHLINLSVPLDKIDHPLAREHFEALINCWQEEGAGGPGLRAIEAVFARRLAGENGSKNLLSLEISLFKRWVAHLKTFSTEGANHLAARWIDKLIKEIRSGEFALPVASVVSEAFEGDWERSWPAGLIRWLAQWRKTYRQWSDQTFGILARAIRHNSAMTTLDFFKRDIITESSLVVGPSVSTKVEIENLASDNLPGLVRQVECWSQDPVFGRIKTVEREPFLAINNWEWSRDHGVRTDWPEGEWSQCLAGQGSGYCHHNLIQKLFEPSEVRGGPDRVMLDHLLAMLGLFSLEPGELVRAGGHYESSYLARWIEERSTRLRAIPYYYVGEENPRVKVVSDLDMLEQVLINADIEVKTNPFGKPRNMSFRFLEDIALAWGDEPRRVWPAEVQAMFPEGRHQQPKTLRQAYEGIDQFLGLLETFVGYPDRPSCWKEGTPHRSGTRVGRGLFGPLHQAAIFNLRQVLPVVKENLPGEPGESAGGLRVIRDLLYTAFSSTPKDKRGHDRGWSNNLSMVTQLARLGFIRNISRLDMQNSEIVASRGMLHALTSFADNPGLANLFKELYQRGPVKGQLFIEVLEELHRRFKDEESSDFALFLLAGLQQAEAPFGDRLIELVASIVERTPDPTLDEVIDFLVDLQFIKGGLLAGLPEKWVRSQDYFHKNLLQRNLLVLLDNQKWTDQSIAFALTMANPAEPLRKSWDEWRSRASTPEWDWRAWVNESLAPGIGRDTLDASRDPFADRFDPNSAGSIGHWLDWIAEDPEGFYRFARSASRTLENGELQGLLDRWVSYLEQ